MQALRLHAPADLRLESIDPPVAPSGWATIAVEACGVCGSDHHFVEGTARTEHLPITLGHEVAGSVIDPGSAPLDEGDEVVLEVGWFCDECERCREGRPNLCRRPGLLGQSVDGGLAGTVVVPSRTVTRRPPGLPPSVAATAVDAGATAFHAVTRRSGGVGGSSVLIIGIGGLGTYGLQFARLLGATGVVAVDTSERALGRARELGADETVLVEPGMSLGRKVKELTGGGVDIAMEFVGRAATVDAAVKSLRPGGTAVAVGVGIEPLSTIPPVLWSNNEYTLTGSYGSLPGDAATVLGDLASGRVLPPPITEVTMEEAAILLSQTLPDGRMVVIP